MKPSIASAVLWDVPSPFDSQPSSGTVSASDARPTEPLARDTAASISPAEIRDAVVAYARASISPDDEAHRIHHVLRAAAAAAHDADFTEEQFRDFAAETWRVETP